MTRLSTERRTPTRAELLQRSIGIDTADEAFRRMVASLPDQGGALIAACRRMNTLTAAMVAERNGEGQMHGILAGSAARVAPAYRAERPGMVAAEALFGKGGE